MPYRSDWIYGRPGESHVQAHHDATNMVNRIRVRGGLSPDPTEATDTFTGTGSQTIFQLTNRWVREITSVTVGGACKTFGTAWWDAAGFDCYVNYPAGIIYFGTAPGNGVSVKVYYTYHTEVYHEAQVSPSPSAPWSDTEIEDRSITSLTEAELLAAAVLQEYGTQIVIGSFLTNKLGLEPGMEIEVSDPVLGLSGPYTIRKVTTEIDKAGTGVIANVQFGGRETKLSWLVSKLAPNMRAGAYGYYLKMAADQGASNSERVTDTATDYTAKASDSIVAVTDTTTGRTVTLPDAATVGKGRTITIKDISGGAGTNNITLSPATGTIDGAASQVINVNYGAYKLYSDGTNWKVLSDTNLVAKDGTIKGTLIVGTGSPTIVIDGANKLIKSSNYAAGTAGWQIESDGSAEFNDVTVRGTVNAIAGYFGDSSNRVAIEAAGLNVGASGSIRGGQTDYNTGTGFFLGYSGAAYKFSIGSGTTGVTWDGSALTVNGAVVTDLEPGSEIAIEGWQCTCAFSASDNNTVAWGAGQLILTDGTVYNISAGNTGDMSARTYIYFDKAVSTSTLRTTTTASTAVGSGKILVGAAINSTNEALYQVYSGVGGVQIAGSNIEPLSITATEIAAGTITANEIAGNTITTNKLAADAINGMTITAPTIRTAASGARIELNSTKIFGTDGTTDQWYADASTGKLYAGGGAVILDQDGITVAGGSNDWNSIKWAYSGVNIGRMQAYQTSYSSLSIQAKGLSSGLPNSALILTADTYLGPSVNSAQLSLATGASPTVEIVAGAFHCDADIVHVVGGVDHTGYIFVPLTSRITHASYDGDAVNTGTYNLSLTTATGSGGWGLPAGIKAVAVRLAAVWAGIGSASGGNYAYLQTRGGGGAPVLSRAQVAGYYMDAAGIVPCDATYNDISLVVGGANASGITIEIYGYWI